MGKRVAWTLAGVRLSCILLVSWGAGSTALAQANRDAASPSAVGSVPATPKISGAAGASDWLPGSPAAADSAAADSMAARSATAGDTPLPTTVISIGDDKSAGGTSNTGTSVPGQTPTIPPSLLGPAARSSAASTASSSAGSPGSASADDHFLRLPPNTATGVSIGYPAYPGLFIVAPADGPFAFRSGLTGFPTIGLLWTPGLEYRFGQERGTLSQDGVYAFGNAFLGRTYLNADAGYAGAEAGLGLRWFIDDRRGVRWIAALEAGGYWRRDPVKPRHLCLRFLWSLVE